MPNKKVVILQEKQQCMRCKKWKCLSRFSKNRNYASGYQTLCKACDSARKRKQSRENKYMLEQLKYNGCVLCGYRKNFTALIFHHVNPENKKFNLSEYGRKGQTALLIEYYKTIVLCKNCHAELHNPERLVE